MKTELIENIGFTKEEYNARTLGEDVASFDEFINAIVAFVEESGGSLEDAVVMGNTIIKAGAKVKHCILAENVIIGENAAVGQMPEG